MLAKAGGWWLLSPVACAMLLCLVGPARAQDDARDPDGLYQDFDLDASEAAPEPPEPGETEERKAADESDEAAAGAAGATPRSADEHKKLETLTVSAKRGTQDLQTLPEAVSSFGSNDLLEQGLTDFNTLQYNVPSLFSGEGLTKITLRGVGGEIVGPGIDPGFAVHINNVFSARETTGLLDYFDIERVDVFRGPQGTLWGRNSTGGAVNIITKRPVHAFDASADIEYGGFANNAHGVRLRGMFNAPLVEDTLALRIAFLAHYNDGLMRLNSENNSQQVKDARNLNIRGSLLWEPHEDVTVDLIGSWLGVDDAANGRKFEGDYVNPPGSAWVGSGPGMDFTGALPNPDSPYKGTANDRQRQNSDVGTVTLLVGWQADHFKLDSISGFQSTDYFQRRDQDTSSLPISTLDLTDKSRQVSQEFILNSNFDFPANFTVGTIYQYDWTPETTLSIPDAQNTVESVNWHLYPSLAPPLFPSLSLVDGCPPTSPFAPAGYPPECPPIKPLGELRDDFVHATTKVKNHVLGVYANVSWEIIEALTLNVGGRFSYTHRNWDDGSLAMSYSSLGPGLDPFGLQVLQRGLHQREDWMAGTWKVSLDYQLFEQHLLWASVGTGSRAGGFNFTEEEPFDDEKILAVEAGTKSMFFDNRLMLNLTGFWYDWDDPQIASTVNALPVTVNAPSATSYGIELEWRALPLDELQLSGTFGWLEAFYDADFVSPDASRPQYDVNGYPGRPVNLNGARVPRSPRFSVSVGAQYTFDFGEYGTVMPRVDFYFRDWITFRQYGNPDDRAPSYTRTDVRILWRSQSGKWWGELYGRNLENNAVKTNQELLARIYRVHYYDSPINGGFRFGFNWQ
jgi:iron complex outermembrane receptor protein